MFGWFGSGPIGPRPFSRRPESHDAPGVPHFGALSVASYVATGATAREKSLVVEAAEVTTCPVAVDET